jgi:hypothetical protein
VPVNLSTAVQSQRASGAAVLVHIHTSVSSNNTRHYTRTNMLVYSWYGSNLIWYERAYQ